MPKLTPFLWFDTQAEEAAEFYCSIFPNSKITQVARYGETGPGPAGSVMMVAFELDGKPFNAMNGGPGHPHTDAVSFVIDCKTQAEVDHYWDRLTDGGRPIACGWLQDRYGLSWQVTPDRLIELVSSKDKTVASRAMAAMMKMVKIDIAQLEAAVAGEPVA